MYLKMGNGRKKDLRSLSISYNELRRRLKNNKMRPSREVRQDANPFREGVIPSHTTIS
jgi:hypothetical protein